MEVAGPLGTTLGLAQRKRASPRGEAGTSGFLSVSDSDRRVPAIPGLEDPLEKEMATHSVFLPRESMDRRAWWATVSSWGHKRVRHDLATKLKNSNKRCENWGTEKLNNLLKVTQLVIIGTSFQTLAQKAQIISSLY